MTIKSLLFTSRYFFPIRSILLFFLYFALDFVRGFKHISPQLAETFVIAFHKERKYVIGTRSVFFYYILLNKS